MDKLDIVFAILGIEFTALCTLLGFMWKHMNAKFDKIEKRIDDVEDKLGNRIDRLSEKVVSIDRSLCRLEGAFSSKEFCGLRQSDYKKAE